MKSVSLACANSPGCCDPIVVADKPFFGRSGAENAAFVAEFIGWQRIEGAWLCPACLAKRDSDDY